RQPNGARICLTNGAVQLGFWASVLMKRYLWSKCAARDPCSAAAFTPTHTRYVLHRCRGHSICLQILAREAKVIERLDRHAAATARREAAEAEDRKRQHTGLIKQFEASVRGSPQTR